MNENDLLLRELFRDEPENAFAPEVDEAFVHRVMQDVRLLGLRRLMHETAPWLLAVVLVTFVFWSLLPQLQQFSAATFEWTATLKRILSALSIDSRSLLAALAFVFALSVPSLLDRLPRRWQI